MKHRTLSKLTLALFATAGLAGTGFAKDAQSDANQNQRAQNQRIDNAPSMDARGDTNPKRNPAATTTGKQQGSAQGDRATRAQDSRMMQASRLIGLDVRDRNGERLGDVEDVVIDARDCTVRYAVVGFGGFLGLGEKHFVYPVNALRTSGRDELTLNVPRERLEQSPGYEGDRWPGNDDDNFWSGVDRFFENDRSGAAQTNQQGGRQLVRASELLGKDIVDRSGADVGEIDDVMLNLRDRKVHYVVMQFDRSWNADDKLVALPLDAFKSFGADELTVQRDRESLRSAPSFERSAWPDFTDPTVRQHFGTWFRGAPTTATTATTAMPGMTASRFEQLDTNRDGQLSRQEAGVDRKTSQQGASGASTAAAQAQGTSADRASSKR